MPRNPTSESRRKSLFKPGQSGNPKGRPRKARTLDETVLGAVNRPVTVTENGRSRKRKMLDVIATQISTQGAKGNLAAGKIALDMVRKAEERNAQVVSAPSQLSGSDKEIAERFVARQRRIWEQEKETGDE